MARMSRRDPRLGYELLKGGAETTNNKSGSQPACPSHNILKDKSRSLRGGLRQVKGTTHV
jgi:hypothetical protein